MAVCEDRDYLVWQLVADDPQILCRNVDLNKFLNLSPTVDLKINTHMCFQKKTKISLHNLK